MESIHEIGQVIDAPRQIADLQADFIAVAVGLGIVAVVATILFVGVWFDLRETRRRLKDLETYRELHASNAA